MLNTVIATRFIGTVGNGKTKPIRIECDDDNGNSYELVVKYSIGCHEREKSLILESIAAMLAADLGLPVPEPFVVSIDDDFISALTDQDVIERLRQSNKLAFGSKIVPNGFSIWPTGQKIPDHLAECAAEIYVFDALIINSDRRPLNPNCLFSGDELAIIDHELTFGIVLLWVAPWMEGGFGAEMGMDNHIFAKPYFNKVPENLDRFIYAWESISDDRFQEYKNAIPPEWIQDIRLVDEIIQKLINAKLNIRNTVDNALKALA